MSFDKKKFKEQEKALMQRAAEIEAMNFDSDPGSYEDFRDGYRFMTRVSVYTFTISFLFNIASAFFIFSVEPGKTFATTRDGRLKEVVPIAYSFDEMKSIRSSYNDRPEVLLKMRDHFNPNEPEAVE